MDDARIQSLKQEVLAQLREGRAAEVGGGPTASGSPGGSGLEARVAALESVVAQLVSPQLGVDAWGKRLGPRDATAPLTMGHAPAHPSFQVFTLPGPAPDRCVMEPDKPCVKSHACRTFGY